MDPARCLKMLLLTLSCVLIALAWPARAAPTVSVAGPAQVQFVDGFPADSFVVEIRIHDAVDLYAYQFDLVFDPSLVVVTSVGEGSFLSTAGATFFDHGAVTPLGDLAFITLVSTLFGPVAGASGDGVLAILQFEPMNPGTLPIGLAAGAVFLDAALADLAVDTLTASIDIRAVPEPGTAALVAIALAALCRRQVRQGCSGAWPRSASGAVPFADRLTATA